MIINKINREKIVEDKKDFDILNMLNSIKTFSLLAKNGGQNYDF